MTFILLLALSQVSTTPPPVVLMVRSAVTAEGRRHEDKLYDELGFALDGFMVMGLPAEQPDFSKLSLAMQIRAIVPEAERNDAKAVVWLSFPLSNQMMLHLVAIGSGRALVRTIETDRSPISEATLALMARELLGTAYLFESPRDLPLGVAEVVRDVKKTIPAELPAPSLPGPPGARWSAWAGAQADYSISGGADAVPVWHVLAGLERRLPLDLDGALGVSGSFGSIARPDTAGAAFWTAGGRLSLYRGFPLAPLSLGPFAAASLEYASFVGPAPSLAVLLPGVELGAQARSDGSSASGPAVALSLSVGYAPVQGEYRAGDGRVLFRTPVLRLILGLAVGWRGL